METNNYAAAQMQRLQTWQQQFVQQLQVAARPAALSTRLWCESQLPELLRSHMSAHWCGLPSVNTGCA